MKFFKFFIPKYLLLFFKKNIYLFKYRKKNIKIDSSSIIYNSDLGCNVFIGRETQMIDSSIDDFSYINSDSIIKNCKIGKFCSIGMGVKISLGKHPVNFISTHPVFYSNNKPFETFADNNYFTEFESVQIGNDVWIGDDVFIPGGVIIGDGAVIAAKSVVTKDVEPYAIVGGIPAKLIKYRFSQSEISKLLEIKWWERDKEWLKMNFEKFHNKDIFFTSFK